MSGVRMREENYTEGVQMKRGTLFKEFLYPFFSVKSFGLRETKVAHYF